MKPVNELTLDELNQEIAISKGFYFDKSYRDWCAADGERCTYGGQVPDYSEASLWAGLAMELVYNSMQIRISEGAVFVCAEGDNPHKAKSWRPYYSESIPEAIKQAYASMKRQETDDEA